MDRGHQELIDWILTGPRLACGPCGGTGLYDGKECYSCGGGGRVLWRQPADTLLGMAASAAIRQETQHALDIERVARAAESAVES